MAASGGLGWSAEPCASRPMKSSTWRWVSSSRAAPSKSRARKQAISRRRELVEQFRVRRGVTFPFGPGRQADGPLHALAHGHQCQFGHLMPGNAGCGGLHTDGFGASPLMLDEGHTAITSLCEGRRC